MYFSMKNYLKSNRYHVGNHYLSWDKVGTLNQ